MANEKRAKIILHYDAWDENENRLPAAPIIGKNEAGNDIREEVTDVSADLAKKLVAAGKASVPLVIE